MKKRRSRQASGKRNSLRGFSCTSSTMVRSSLTTIKFTTIKKITGDFDVEVDFNDLKFESFENGWGLGFDLQAEIDDVVKSSVAIGVQGDKSKNIFAKASLSHDLATGKRHYDVQLIAGLRLLSGCVVEMETGEGKKTGWRYPASFDRLWCSRTTVFHRTRGQPHCGKNV